MEPPVEPPRDPEEWTDEQWITWLAATDDPMEENRQEDPPATLGARVVRSSGGAVLGAAMTGLAEIFHPKRDPDVVVVADVPDDSDDPDLVVRLDRDHPERSVATVRLHDDQGQDEEGRNDETHAALGHNDEAADESQDDR